jgi:hypothetical protein
MNKRFVIGINKAKMKWYDVEQDAQSGIMGNDVNNAIDESIFTSKGSKGKKAFKDFKV